MASKVTRICKELVEKLEKIKEQEKEKGISNTSDYTASEILIKN